MMRIGLRLTPEHIEALFTIFIYAQIVATLILAVMGVRWLLLERQAKPRVETTRVKTLSKGHK
jgi:hypothetical protein